MEMLHGVTLSQPPVFTGITERALDHHVMAFNEAIEHGNSERFGCMLKT